VATLISISSVLNQTPDDGQLQPVVSQLSLLKACHTGWPGRVHLRRHHKQLSNTE